MGDKREILRARLTSSLEERRIVCKFLSDLKVPHGCECSWGKNSRNSWKSWLPRLYARLTSIHFSWYIRQGFVKGALLNCLYSLNCYTQRLWWSMFQTDWKKILPLPFVSWRVSSFFNIMFHLPIHLAHQAPLGELGPYL